MYRLIVPGKGQADFFNLPTTDVYADILKSEIKWRPLRFWMKLAFHAWFTNSIISFLILVNNQINAQFFLVCLFLFSTCFGQPCAHHQDNYCIIATPGLCHCVDDRLVCWNICFCIISILYMFRAAMCPSSGELLYQCDTWLTSLCRWPYGMLEHMLLHYFYSLHVSGSHVSIIRRIIVSMRHLVYVTLCRWPSGM